MKFNRWYLVVIVAITIPFSGTESQAQDPRFSQFYAAPLQINPALTGVFEGRWRVNGIYRDQWGSILGSVPFRTVGASYDMRYRVVKNDYFAFGLSALRDEVGEGHFIQNRAYLNFSYLKQIGGSRSGASQYLVAGGQVGGGQNQVQFNNFWFSEQFDLSIGGFPNAALDNRESSLIGESQNSDIFLDFNAGLLYYAVLGSNTSIYAGAAIHHLNNPEISFFENNAESLSNRIVGHLGGELGFNDQLSILPAAIFMKQGVLTSLTTGANIRYQGNERNEIALRLGLWPHFSSTPTSRFYFESLAFTAILEMERVNFGVSYDITVSDLQEANNSRGAFELSLIYVHPEGERRVKTVCPKF